jgi:hypothetical protein
MSGDGETAGSPNARQALLTAVDEHAGDAGAPVGDVIEAALEDVNGGLGRVCSALQQLQADGEVYQPNPTTVRRVATDGGQLTQRQQRQAEKLQLKHAAEQGREQRLQTALETGEVGKQGQRIWIIPEFEPDEAEADYIPDAAREALPEYDVQVVVGDRAKPITKDRIHDMLLGSGEEDDVRTDGGRSAGNPETRLGEARKQLRIVLRDVEFEDEDTAENVAGALACAESAAVCLEGEDALDGEPSITDAPVPMVKSVGPLGTTILGPDPGAFQAWQNRRDGGDGR